MLNGVLKKEGLQLLGGVLAFLINTDKSEHVNVSILLPLCRSLFFDLTGVLPFKIKQLIAETGRSIPVELSSGVLTNDQKATMANLFREYLESLMNHVKETRSEMSRIHKSIKRQERTKGTAFLSYA